MAKGQRPQKNSRPKSPRARDAGKEAQWRATLAAWDRSNLNVREFCRREKIREAQFYAWRRQIQLRDRENSIAPRTARPSKNNGSNPFVPLNVVAEKAITGKEASSSLEIFLPSGARIIVKPGSPIQVVAQLLREIEVM